MSSWQEKVQQIDENIVQNALDETGFGKFNYKVLAVAALICMNSSFGMLSNGFILPAAACDFKMTTEDKGHLTTSTMLGMLSGSYFWGCFADTKGRRTSLLGSLFLHSGSELLSSLVPYYWGFVIFKFTSGLAVCGQLTVLYTFLAEFQPMKKRDLFLSWMETSWVTGMVIVACVAWVTIPLNIGFETEIFSFKSWNLFVMICSLPSFIIGIWLIFLPETPKYLAEIGQNVHLLNVLSRMYSENTGNPSEEYLTNLKNSNNQLLAELVHRLEEKKENKEDKIRVKTLKAIIKDTFLQTLMLVRKPYLHRTFIVCSVTYLIMTSYYMLLLWLPDLFQRYAEFQRLFPNQSATVCTVVAFDKNNNNNETELSMDPIDCNIPIQNSVFLYAFILALSGVPVGLTLPLLINRLGYKFFLIVSTIIASFASYCIFLVTTSVENLIISCIFESFTSICVSVVSCMLIDFYPTHLRSIAAGLASFFSRLGAMIGTMMTGLLIDNHCTVLIVLVGSQLLRLDFLEDGGVDFEHAITVTGFGKFHYMLLAICGLIYMDTAIGVTILSFVLPAAQCDLEMDSTAKGWLTASPMLGMVVGSYIWGCLADTKGRKVVLIATLLMDGIVGVISSFVQYFWVFLIFRFFNGFAVTGAMGICFPYLGEFQPTKYRERCLCWMEMFWTVGVILLPLIAWLIVPLDLRYESEVFHFKSWNLFVALCALPSIVLGLWLFAFPESPKFLLECGEPDAALEVFKWIYAQNTGQDPETYPVKCLQEKSNSKDKSTRSLKLHKKKDLKVLFSEVWELTMSLYKPPYLRNTLLACAIQFGLTSSYYTLMVWFPELFTRFEEFEHDNPGETTSVCIVSSLSDNSTNLDPYGCETTIGLNVYLHTVYLGLACIPGSIILPIFVHKLGAKFFLILSLLVSGAVTVGFYFVINSTQNLILSCIFEALTSLGISLVYCIIVDMFPTNLRVMAAALSLTMGRLGALVGNLIFGYLIDLACIVPIVIFAAFLFLCGFLSFALPRTGKETLD